MTIRAPSQVIFARAVYVIMMSNVPHLRLIKEDAKLIIFNSLVRPPLGL